MLFNRIFLRMYLPAELQNSPVCHEWKKLLVSTSTIIKAGFLEKSFQFFCCLHDACGDTWVIQVIKLYGQIHVFLTMFLKLKPRWSLQPPDEWSSRDHAVYTIWDVHFFPSSCKLPLLFLPVFCTANTCRNSVLYFPIWRTWQGKTVCSWQKFILGLCQ